MSVLNLNKLMLEYSKRGIQDWNNAAHDLRTKSMKYLSNSIAENENEINKIIYDNQKKPLFVPMPMQSSKGSRGFEWCFFLPEWCFFLPEWCFFLPEWCFFLPKKKYGRLNSLILFLLVNRARGDCLAFRFETSIRQNTPHGYPHMQLTRKMAESSSSSENSIKGVPEWLPDRYPAFPIPAHDPLEMFLCMVTAVHGFRGGIDDLLVDIFQRASLPSYALQYKRKLDKMLNTNP